VLKRFVLTFLAFIGLIVPAALLLAMLAAPASPAPLERPGCEQTLADTNASVAAMQARVKSLGAAPGPEICNATRRYFLEVVKARAVTALCKNGADREHELDRLDADVEHINEAIAARCS
jgi:hypothetical protein